MMAAFFPEHFKQPGICIEKTSQESASKSAFLTQNSFYWNFSVEVRVVFCYSGLDKENVFLELSHIQTN